MPPHPAAVPPAGTILVLSAHPGDAARAVGAAIARRADTDRNVALATLFAGGDDMASAREDDERACLVLNAEFAHRSLPEAGRRGYGPDDRMGSPRADDPVVPALRQDVAGLIDAYRPIAVWTACPEGGDVDQVLLCRVLSELTTASRTRIEVAYWRDQRPAGDVDGWQEPRLAEYEARKHEACAAYRAADRRDAVTGPEWFTAAPDS